MLYEVYEEVKWRGRAVAARASRARALRDEGYIVHTFTEQTVTVGHDYILFALTREEENRCAVVTPENKENRWKARP